MQQLKKDPFFAEIQWERLAKRDLQPPAILSKADLKKEEVDEKQEELAKLFEDSNSKEGVIFEDEDYVELNRRINRVKNYSFSIGTPR